MNALTIDRTEPRTGDTAGVPSTFAQLFSVGGGFVAWNAQLVANYALAANPCFQRGHALGMPAAGVDGGGVRLIINLAAVAVTLAAIAIGVRAMRWARAHSSSEEPQPRIVGRTRVLGICGVLSGGLFLLATLFVLAAMLGTPQCAR